MLLSILLSMPPLCSFLCCTLLPALYSFSIELYLLSWPFFSVLLFSFPLSSLSCSALFYPLRSPISYFLLLFNYASLYCLLTFFPFLLSCYTTCSLSTCSLSTCSFPPCFLSLLVSSLLLPSLSPHSSLSLAKWVRCTTARKMFYLRFRSHYSLVFIWYLRISALPTCLAF